jgi:hypothetical protein
MMAARRLNTLIKLFILVSLVAVFSQFHQTRRMLTSRFNFIHMKETANIDGLSLLSRSNSNRTDAVLFPVKPLVIWSNDYHIAPINDLKQLLQPLGVRFIDKSLSRHCHVTETCDGRKTLKVINRTNAMHLDPALIPQFVKAYGNDSELLSADAFACFLPPAMCELFEPFNRSLLIVVPTRYEAGRLGSDRWTRWNENLLRMSKDPRNIIAANNLYDAEYVRYFTGIRPRVLPSYCGYMSHSYKPTRRAFILAPIHNARFAKLFNKWHKKSCRKINCTARLFPLRSRYPRYKYGDIASHQGIVYVPYQVSVMSLFEQYRMNIPLFFPSTDLLTTWQLKYTVRLRFVLPATMFEYIRCR